MCLAHWTHLQEIADIIDAPNMVAKADDEDPLEKSGFDAAVIAATAAVLAVVKAPERVAMARISRKLKRNWAAMTVAQRDRAIAAAMAEMLPLSRVLAPKVGASVEASYSTMLSATNKAAADAWPAVSLATSLDVVDQRVVRNVATSQRFFIRDEYGRRHASYSAQARGIVASGVSRGMDSGQISIELERRLALANIGRSRSYYRNVSSIYQARARSYGLLKSFSESKITHYRFDAVLDGRTTEQCRFLHDKRFAVAKALEKYQSVPEEDPESVYGIQPFMNVGRDKDGQFLYYRSPRDGPRKQVARIDKPAVGKVDKVGSYSRAMSPGAIESAGMSTPPLHGLCRSTLQPEF